MLKCANFRLFGLVYAGLSASISLFVLFCFCVVVCVCVFLCGGGGGGWMVGVVVEGGLAFQPVTVNV